MGGGLTEGACRSRPPYTPCFQRFRDALTGRLPDRVPLFDFVMSREVMQGFLGRQIRTAADEADFWMSAGYDYAVANVAVPLGSRRLSSPHSQGIQWRDDRRGVIRGWDDFRAYTWPDPAKLDYGPLERMAAVLTAGVKLVTVAGNFYAKVEELFGFETFALLLFDDYELVEAVVERMADITFDILDRVTRIPEVGAVVTGGDIAHAGGTLIDPRTLRALVFPKYRRVTELCHARGIPVIHHSDGNLWDVMDDLIDAGFDGFHPFEPKAMDIVEAKRRYGDRVCIMGNVDLDLLARGTPAQVRAAVRQKIVDLARGGRYCLSSSNSIAPYVPPVNFGAMIQASWELGGVYGD